MKRLNIFDFDGTLAYTLIPLYNVYKYAFLDIAGVKLTKEMWMKYYGKNFPDILVGEFNIFDKDLFEEISQYKYERYPKEYLTTIMMNPYLLEESKVYEEGSVNVICTLTKRSVVQEILKYNKIDHLFSAIYDREDVLYKKPAPDIYIKALSDWHIKYNGDKAKHIHMYEDSTIGMTSATNAVNEMISFLSDVHVSIHKVPEEKM